jgi:hypothetical protein
MPTPPIPKYQDGGMPSPPIPNYQYGGSSGSGACPNLSQPGARPGSSSDPTSTVIGASDGGSVNDTDVPPSDTPKDLQDKKILSQARKKAEASGAMHPATRGDLGEATGASAA